MTAGDRRLRQRPVRAGPGRRSSRTGRGLPGRRRARRARRRRRDARCRPSGERSRPAPPTTTDAPLATRRPTPRRIRPRPGSDPAVEADRLHRPTADGADPGRDELADLLSVRPDRVKFNVCVLVDAIALKRGYATATETCEIPGFGPVDVDWVQPHPARIDDRRARPRPHRHQGPRHHHPPPQEGARRRPAGPGQTMRRPRMSKTTTAPGRPPPRLRQARPHRVRQHGTALREAPPPRRPTTAPASNGSATNGTGTRHHPEPANPNPHRVHPVASTGRRTPHRLRPHRPPRPALAERINGTTEPSRSGPPPDAGVRDDPSAEPWRSGER